MEHGAPELILEADASELTKDVAMALAERLVKGTISDESFVLMGIYSKEHGADLTQAASLAWEIALTRLLTRSDLEGALDRFQAALIAFGAPKIQVNLLSEQIGEKLDELIKPAKAGVVGPQKWERALFLAMGQDEPEVIEAILDGASKAGVEVEALQALADQEEPPDLRKIMRAASVKEDPADRVIPLKRMTLEAAALRSEAFECARWLMQRRARANPWSLPESIETMLECVQAMQGRVEAVELFDQAVIVAAQSMRRAGSAPVEVERKLMEVIRGVMGKGKRSDERLQSRKEAALLSAEARLRAWGKDPIGAESPSEKTRAGYGRKRAL